MTQSRGRGGGDTHTDDCSTSSLPPIQAQNHLNTAFSDVTADSARKVSNATTMVNHPALAHIPLPFLSTLQRPDGRVE